MRLLQLNYAAPVHYAASAVIYPAVASVVKNISPASPLAMLLKCQSVCCNGVCREAHLTSASGKLCCVSSCWVCRTSASVVYIFAASAVSCVAPAPVVYVALALVVKYICPAHAMSCATPASVVEYLSSFAVLAAAALVVKCIAPAPTMSCTAPAHTLFAVPAPVETYLLRQPKATSRQSLLWNTFLQLLQGMSRQHLWRHSPAPPGYAASPLVTTFSSPAAAVYPASAPVDQCITPACCESSSPAQYAGPAHHEAVTMTVTCIDLNRDGTPDVLQQPQVSYAAAMEYGRPRSYAPTLQNVLTVT